MRKKTLKFFISLALVLALLLFTGVACARDNEGADVSGNEGGNDDVADSNAPIYTGMTVAEFDASQSTLAAIETGGVTNLSSITQLTDAAPAIPDVYQDEDIVITILFDNPKNFEILSFTINDVKYSSYMFEEGSTMSAILVKTNVGSTFGPKEYTISAVKYVDGTAIKDVVMKGDQTLKINVYGLEGTEIVDGLTYNLYSNKTAVLTIVPQSVEEVIIRPYINDHKVIAMAESVFEAHYGCHTLVYIPKEIESIPQIVQGSETRVVYVLGGNVTNSIGSSLAQYAGIAYENLVKYDDCYYIISEQGATLIRYTGTNTEPYIVPATLSINGQTINVIQVGEKAFNQSFFSAICDYVFTP